MTDITYRLRARCSGHPNAPIPWPHRDLHDAIAEIERLRAVRDQASHLLLGIMLPMDTAHAQANLKALIAETWATSFSDPAHYPIERGDDG